MGTITVPIILEKLKEGYDQLEKFDVIVVGGGLAGLAAAYTLAQHDLEVLVLEKRRLLWCQKPDRRPLVY